MAGEGDESPFLYHLQLTPQQLKITHTALRSLLDDFGHDEAQVQGLVQEVLSKLPDEHAIRAIQLGRETRGAEEILAEPPRTDEEPQPGGDEPPPSVA
jgi:hypothetical protein